MADGAGIDRKADEKIQFSTSKEVTVHPTFESMSLKGAPQTKLYSHCAMR
jgi:ATP-dependent RNA helicase